jgi:hypothetical protein
MRYPGYDRWTGATVEEYLALAPGELEEDAVGLWQIAPAGKYDFGLKGRKLERFVRRYICALLDRGAKPVKSWPHGPLPWRRVKDYGETKYQIVNAVVREWRTLGRDPDVHDVWFALPRIYNSPLQPLPFCWDD